MGSEDGASDVGIMVGLPVGAGSEGICDGNPVGTGLGGSMHGPQYPSPGLWHGTGSGSMRQC